MNRWQLRPLMCTSLVVVIGLCQHSVAGMPNKTVARRLDVSLRTVEARRKAVFDKLGARSLALLVQLVIQAGGIPVRTEQSVLANA